MHKRLFLLTGGVSALTAALAGCAGNPLAGMMGWTTLIEGSGNLDQWNTIGNANWRMEDGAAMADSGAGFLVSKQSYRDFEIRAEFWSDADANSGIFMRCQDPKVVTDKNAYEVNIFDKRPDPTYATGAIVGFAKIDRKIIAAGRWNTYEVMVKGDMMTVTLNGERTVELRDSRFASGPIALQRTAGVVKFRKVQIRTL